MQHKIFIISTILGIFAFLFLIVILVEINNTTQDFTEDYPSTNNDSSNQNQGELASLSNLKEEPDENKEIRLSFVETSTNCSFDGKVYVGKFFLGETKNGYFNLSKKVYDFKFKENNTVYIKGLTGDCFKENKNLPIYSLWTEVPDLTQNFEEEVDFKFITERNPRFPVYPAEYMGLVRPNETIDYLNKMILTRTNTIEDLDTISNFYIQYDYGQYDLRNYKWLTPSEILKNNLGNCKDWSITFLSFIKAYNPDLRCYDIFWLGHMNVFCYINKRYIIYDMQATKSSAVLKENSGNNYIINEENKIALRKMLDNYFETFGLPVEDRYVQAIFNDQEFISFNGTEDFVGWMYNLRNE